MKTPHQFEVRKPTTIAFHTSQHVTGPPTACSSQEEPGGGGGDDQPTSTACFCRCRCSAAYLGGLQHGQRARHGGKRLVSLLDIHGELVGRGEGGGARLQGGGWGVMEVGSCGEGAMGEKRKWEGQTETRRKGQTMKKPGRVDKDRGGERVKSMAGEDKQPGLESSTVVEQMKDVR